MVKKATTSSKPNKKNQNPQTKFFHDAYPRQKQPYPGLNSKLKPEPDSGEESYKGNGRLEGKKVLITGGDSGIGRAAAIAYAREGADVAINYLESEEKDAQQVKHYIEEAGRKAVLIPGDLANEKFCRKMVERAYKSLGGLDILILNAGYQQYSKNIEELSTEQLYRTFEINLFSMFWIVQAALPFLKPGASIITTASIQAFKPSEELLDYAASKAAIVAFTRALAKQLASRGIRVNAVAPGPIWTPLQVAGGHATNEIPSFGQDTPMKRAGQPVELASVYVLLGSDESSYTTAEVYGVTGGNHTT